MLVAIDIETYDPNLDELGDGSIRKDGRILCCGAYGDSVEKVFDFDYPNDVAELRDIMADPSIDKIYHNGIGYDLPWLCCGYGMPIAGIQHDTMTRAALIDERKHLDLDSCCARMGLKGKNKNETIEVWYAAYQAKLKSCAKGFKKGKISGNTVLSDDPDKGYIMLTDDELNALALGTYKKDVWANIMSVWNAPEGKALLKKYNIQDCKATYNLFLAQEAAMRPLQGVYELECKIVPVLLKAKRTGIRIDKAHMERLTERVHEACVGTEKKLVDTYGITCEMIASSKQLGERLNEMGIISPVKTATGAQSWAAGALSRIHHPVVPLIQEYKNYSSVRDKYLNGALSKAIIGDRIHCTWLPMLREDGGTVTGRMSCRKPNLQQIPARNKGHGTDFSQDMRAIFLPEEGQMIAADDYSQIEALLLGHFAKGPQAEWFREQLNNGVDMHKIAMQLTGITYRPVVKTFNYGCIYGMGWVKALENNYTLFEKLAKEEGKDPETFTREVYENYHAKFPVVRDTMAWCERLSKLQGYIDTLGGRRLHKPLPKYDPATGKISDFLYKMLNKLIQGTAADILKQALVTAYEAGIYDVLTLHLLVHDEQVNSVPFNKAGIEAAVELQRIMGNVYKDRLLVPMKAECELGPNWGYWSGDIFEEMKKGNFDPAFFKKDYKETH